MTVLVTGGAGFIGSHMTLELLAAGETVVVLDNLSTGFAAAVPKSVPLVIGDFGDEALVAKIIKDHDVREVIHFAAKIVVPESIADPVAYYVNNTAKALALIGCVAECGVERFIFSSTAAVYGDPESSPVREDTRLSPLSPYGRSKLMVEWILQDISRAHNMNHVALRYFNVAGADPQGRVGQSTANASHLIKTAVRAALGFRNGMDVFGTDYPTPDGSCVRDFIHVTDLVRAHLDALRYLRSGGDSIVCNCGYQTGYSVLEVIEVVKSVAGVDFPVRLSSRRAGDSASVIADNTRIKSLLGWKPVHADLRAMIAQSLAWERRLHNRAA
jgi:UDP-glucose 4-epimerase